MATLGENLISYLSNVVSVHVGEAIPEDVGDTYVWLMQSGEQESDCMSIPAVIESVFYDIEIVGPDIDQVRELTDDVKEAFRAERKYPLGFEDVVETFQIDNHDDNYVPKTQIGQDRPIYIGALSLTVHLVT